MRMILSGAEKALEALIVSILATPMIVKRFADDLREASRQRARRIVHDWWACAGTAAAIVLIAAMLVRICRKRR